MKIRSTFVILAGFTCVILQAQHRGYQKTKTSVKQSSAYNKHDISSKSSRSRVHISAFDKNMARNVNYKTLMDSNYPPPVRSDFDIRLGRTMGHRGKDDPFSMIARYPWKDPKIPISPLPPLMGKQMGVVETPGIAPLGYQLDGKVKVFHLIAQPIEQIMTSRKAADPQRVAFEKEFMKMAHFIDQKYRAWGYNGHTPGPTIECNEGDRIRIIVKNELPEPTTIHWHGIELPWNMDGSGKPILPGETFTYEFTLYQAGAFLYHSGFNIAKQDSFGLVGMLIVHPKQQEEKVDRHIAIMMQEWRILPGNKYINIMEMEEFNWFTFNGHAGPSIPVINIKQGERVRIHFSNLSMDTHPIHIHGHTWWTVGTEGGIIPKSARWPGNTINVPVGATRTVEFVAWNPGVWPLHCHKVHHTMNAHAEVAMGVMGHNGMFTNVNVIPPNLDARWQHPSQKSPSSHAQTFRQILPKSAIEFAERKKFKTEDHAAAHKGHA